MPVVGRKVSTWPCQSIADQSTLESSRSWTPTRTTGGVSVAICASRFAPQSRAVEMTILEVKSAVLLAAMKESMSFLARWWSGA